MVEVEVCALMVLLWFQSAFEKADLLPTHTGYFSEYLQLFLCCFCFSCSLRVDKIHLICATKLTRTLVPMLQPLLLFLSNYALKYMVECFCQSSLH